MDIPEGFIIPDFGPMNAPEGQRGYAGGEEAVYTGPRKMAFICSKGNLDMAYPALIMGNAALAAGVEVHMFFTFWGLDILNMKTNQNLKFTMAANTAMHMPDFGRIKPGLEHFSMPQNMANIPGMTKFSTWYMKREMAKLEIPEIPDFLDLLHASGAHMYGCKLTFDMMKLIEADMHPACEGIITANDFIDISAGAQIVFV